MSAWCLDIPSLGQGYSMLCSFHSVTILFITRLRQCECSITCNVSSGTVAVVLWQWYCGSGGSGTVAVVVVVLWQWCQWYCGSGTVAVVQRGSITAQY